MDIPLDHNFPEPILGSLQEFITEVNLIPLRHIDERLPELDDRQLVIAIHQLGFPASRIRQAHNVLSQILKTAVRARYLPANSAEGVDLPRKPWREQLFLTPTEVDRLAREVAEEYRTLVYVFAYGALRWGGAAALRRRRVDVLRGNLEVAESLAEVGGGLYFGPTKNYRNRVVTPPQVPPGDAQPSARHPHSA